MKLLTIGCIAALAAALSLAGCGKSDDKSVAGPAPKIEKFPESTKISELFPTTVGAQSAFKPTTGTGEMTLKVTDVQDMGGTKSVTVDVFQNGDKSDTIKWRVSDEGIFQETARNGKPYNPPQPVVGPAVNDTKQVDYNGNGPYPSVNKDEPVAGPLKGILRNRGIEVVDTGMGQIEALAVESIYQYSAGKNTYRVSNVTWFAPKYGIVRMLQQTQRSDGQTQSFSMKLTSFRSK